MNLIMVGLTAALYVRGMRRAHPSRGRIAAWCGGVAALVIALSPPLEALTHDLFTAHMIQHLLLLVVAPPLLALAKPLPALLWGLPDALRRRFARIGRSKHLRRAGGILTHPLSVGVLHSAALWLWHLPPMYDAALRDPLVHLAEHISFFASALLYWWSVTHLRGVGVLSIFALALQSSLLGALIAFAPAPLYSAHTDRTAAWGLTALADQQLAGVIMWVPAGMIYTAAALTLLGVWLSVLETRGMAQRRAREVQDAI